MSERPGENLDKRRVSDAFRVLRDILGLGLHELPDSLDEDSFETYLERLRRAVSRKEELDGRKLNDPSYDAPIYRITRRSRNNIAAQMETREERFRWFEGLRRELPLRKYE